MLVTIRQDADPRRVAAELARRGLWAKRVAGAEGVHFLIEAHSAAVTEPELRGIEGVADVALPSSAHPMIDAQAAVIRVGDLEIGEGRPPVMLAGPCSVESEEQIEASAARLGPLGVRLLRGGAFKPRTSPYAFQGHGREALGWMRAAADRHGLKVVTEVLSPGDAELVAAHADLLQIGSRNMHNHALLREASATGRPVLLKRGMAATVQEWLSAAEVCLLHGAGAVLFCERGIRGFDPSTRNVLDLGAVALLSHVYRVPVIVDPSHAAGRRDLIAPLARAALAAGAAGLLLETHDDPGVALSDGPQAMLPAEFEALAASLPLSRISPPHVERPQ